MKKISYRCVSVILLCVGAFLLAINQLSFAITSINQDFAYSEYKAISGDMGILPVKIGIILLILSAVLFILDFLH
jgi:hypothetical protein